MSKESAIEILVFKPDSAIPKNQRGVHENLWIKQRVKQYLSIGVYLDGSDLKYYFFEDCDNTPKIYNSLVELREDLPSGLKNIFEKTPRLFLMGHGHGGRYGLGNVHGPSEAIYNANFDKIITDFEKALPEQHDEMVVTLEACNTDNRALAAEESQKKTFLERLSAKHPNMTFCGTGPWDPKEVETGYRASGGYPKLNLPITSMVGSVWKNGNRVIFYHENRQVVVSKSMLAITRSAKELKMNTINYAKEVLKDYKTKESILQRICESRNISTIEDLKKIPGFPKELSTKNKTTIKLAHHEERIFTDEKIRYISQVKAIVERLEKNEKIESKDLLIIALGLKDSSIFKNHEDLFGKLLANKELLKLVMVESGKVLIAGPNNNNIIDLLLSHDIDINSFDKDGMTALHYAAHLFYVYRKEPLHLIEKLLESSANINVKDNQGRTPLMLASEFGRIEVVKKLLARGASRDATDNQGRTPLMLAKQNAHNDIVPLLERNCAASIISCSSLWTSDDLNRDESDKGLPAASQCLPNLLL